MMEKTHLTLLSLKFGKHFKPGRGVAKYGRGVAKKGAGVAKRLRRGQEGAAWLSMVRRG
jgi:hypothetical protein